MWKALIYTPFTSNLQLFPCHLFPDTQTLEQSAQEYTSERVGEFLEEIGLGDHVASFIEREISGDMLLGDTDETDEMLEELGVESPTEKLKIKVFMGGLVCCDMQARVCKCHMGFWGMPPFPLQRDVFQIMELDALMFSLAIMSRGHTATEIKKKVDKG